MVYTDDGIKVHIILIDVRFHYNEDAIGDRLGKRQIEWLEAIFQEHFDSDVTLIGSGIHIIPQRPWTFVEDVGELAKKQILDLIYKYQKSGVILLTGDVHYAQLFHTNCTSYTGYNLPELCSSGLTHVLSVMTDKIEDFI